jgi:hypothetical protein
MPSISYRHWATIRANALNEIERAHAAVGGTRPGRRYATQQVNQAYAVLLASQFQGFCRDLHAECVDAILTAVAPPPILRPLVQAEFTRGRQLDRGNAQPASIRADFGRFEIDLWTSAHSYDPQTAADRNLLDTLNTWRNAIVHQDFDPGRLGGTTALRLDQVRQWRAACRRLAQSFDEVMCRHLQTLTGLSPW